MKKLLVILFSVFVLVGCGTHVEKNPREAAMLEAFTTLYKAYEEKDAELIKQVTYGTEKDYNDVVNFANGPYNNEVLKEASVKEIYTEGKYTVAYVKSKWDIGKVKMMPRQYFKLFVKDGDDYKFVLLSDEFMAEHEDAKLFVEKSQAPTSRFLESEQAQKDHEEIEAFMSEHEELIKQEVYY